MNELTSIIITGLVTMLTGSGIGSLITMRYTRRQAKNEATRGLQDIYQQMIDDLTKDRNFYKDQTEQLREQIVGLNMKVERLEKEVRENRQALKDLQPSLCGRSNCTQRIFMSALKRKTQRRNADNSNTPPQNRAES